MAQRLTENMKAENSLDEEGSDSNDTITVENNDVDMTEFGDEKADEAKIGREHEEEQGNKESMSQVNDEVADKGKTVLEDEARQGMKEWRHRGLMLEL